MCIGVVFNLMYVKLLLLFVLFDSLGNVNIYFTEFISNKMLMLQFFKFNKFLIPTQSHSRSQSKPFCRLVEYLFLSSQMIFSVRLKEASTRKENFTARVSITLQPQRGKIFTRGKFKKTSTDDVILKWKILFLSLKFFFPIELRQMYWQI